MRRDFFIGGLGIQVLGIEILFLFFFEKVNEFQCMLAVHGYAGNISSIHKRPEKALS